jgi:hypothetical protein
MQEVVTDVRCQMSGRIARGFPICLLPFCLLPSVFLVSGALARPGDDPLSHPSKGSTLGAAGFHGRVRNGIGWAPRAVITRPGQRSKEQMSSVFRVLGAGCGLLEVERLGPLGCTGCPASTCGLSTWWSSTALIET